MSSPSGSRITRSAGSTSSTRGTSFAISIPGNGTTIPKRRPTSRAARRLRPRRASSRSRTGARSTGLRLSSTSARRSASRTGAAMLNGTGFRTSSPPCTPAQPTRSVKITSKPQRPSARDSPPPFRTADPSRPLAPKAAGKTRSRSSWSTRRSRSSSWRRAARSPPSPRPTPAALPAARRWTSGSRSSPVTSRSSRPRSTVRWCVRSLRPRSPASPSQPSSRSRPSRSPARRKRRNSPPPSAAPATRSTRANLRKPSASSWRRTPRPSPRRAACSSTRKRPA